MILVQYTNNILMAMHTYTDKHRTLTLWWGSPSLLCVHCVIHLSLSTSFTALTPKDISDFFQPVFKQGADLKNKWAVKGSTVPKVTVCTCAPADTHTHTGTLTYIHR